MKIIFKNNFNENNRINLKSIEEFIRVMLADIKKDDEEISYLIKEGRPRPCGTAARTRGGYAPNPPKINTNKNFIEIEVNSKILNKKVKFKYRNLGEKIEDQILTMCKIILLKLYDKNYPWGSLMGVRPTKVFRRLLINGCDYTETKEILKNFYLVSDEKISLMETVVKKELELLDKNFINMYIGIPFCPTKCKYCSFASYEINGGVGKYYKTFVEALIKEIEIIGEFLKTYPKKISSIYFGGGTPSTLTEKDLEKIFKYLREKIDFTHIKEFTFEAGREDSLNIQKLEILKKYGVDRISLNPQSFNIETLKRVNRKFNRENFDLIFKKAKDLNFIINMDLIIGLPEETTEEILHTLNEIEKYEIENLTIHSLSFKRASKLFKENRERNFIDRNLIEKKIQELIKRKNLKPYYMYRQKNIIEWGENIGYSLEGKESIFNIEMIEENQNTMALGGGGISKIVVEEKKGIDYIERYVNPKDPALYIRELEKRCEDKINLFKKYL